MAKHPKLRIPNGLVNQRMLHNVDDLRIEVTEDCTWCYSDRKNCFANGFLAAGPYKATRPHTTYRPYKAANAGTVLFNAVTSGECAPELKPKHHKDHPLTPHSIIVT